jgi:hypothetical protein
MASAATNPHLIPPRVARLHEVIEALRIRAPRSMTGAEPAVGPYVSATAHTALQKLLAALMSTPEDS